MGGGGEIQMQSLKAEWISRAHLLRGMSNLNVKPLLLFVHYCNEGQIRVRAKSFRYFLCMKNSDAVRVCVQPKRNFAMMFSISDQWRIQDFPEVGATHIV